MMFLDSPDKILSLGRSEVDSPDKILSLGRFDIISPVKPSYPGPKLHDFPDNVSSPDKQSVDLLSSLSSDRFFTLHILSPHKASFGIELTN